MPGREGAPLVKVMGVRVQPWKGIKGQTHSRPGNCHQKDSSQAAVMAPTWHRSDHSDRVSPSRRSVSWHRADQDGATRYTQRGQDADRPDRFGHIALAHVGLSDAVVGRAVVGSDRDPVPISVVVSGSHLFPGLLPANPAHHSPPPPPARMVLHTGRPPRLSAPSLPPKDCRPLRCQCDGR